MRNESALVTARSFELPSKSSKAWLTAQKGSQDVISYTTKLSEYIMERNAIGMAFCITAAEAEQAFENASRAAKTVAKLDAAHYILKAAFRTATQARTAALETLGSPPVIPT